MKGKKKHIAKWDSTTTLQINHASYSPKINGMAIQTGHGVATKTG